MIRSPLPPLDEELDDELLELDELDELEELEPQVLENSQASCQCMPSPGA